MLKFASKAMKYYLLGVFGFTVTCWIASILGTLHLISPLFPVIGEYLFRSMAFILCLFATAIVIESLR